MAEATISNPLAPELPACLLVDLLWEAFAEQGAAAFAEGRLSTAVADWRVAVRLAESFSRADPRQAASLANLAAAIDVMAEADQANIEALYRSALACWAETPAWIAHMLTEHKPRSSLFHHRMEQKHRMAYRRIALNSADRLAQGGHAACLGNLAGLLSQVGRVDEAKALYYEAITVREPALGARDEGLLRLYEDLGVLLATSRRKADEIRAKARAVQANGPLTTLQRWTRDKPARMSDTRKLLAAVYLTPVIRRHDLRTCGRRRPHP